MSFYNDELDESTQDMLIQAPLTNLGAESEFASLDNDLHRVGGCFTDVESRSKSNQFHSWIVKFVNKNSLNYTSHIHVEIKVNWFSI